MLSRHNRAKLLSKRRTGYRHPQADRIFMVTLVVGFFTIALLLVMLYPSPLHLLRLI